MNQPIEVATFAGGCFWCTEAIFERLKGVKSVLPGYSGGTVSNPTYEAVCTGTTGHAEAIQVVFDPTLISYERLLYVFFKTHDPTTLNQQGADHGTQYRSAIFYHSEEQKKLAENLVEKLTKEKIYTNRIVTEIVPFEKFFEAEDYHKHFYERNKNNGYCQLVINPKLQKLAHEFIDELK